MSNNVRDYAEYQRLLKLSYEKERILFPGKINDVEALVNTCDIGVLFSNKSVHGEGISNSVIEYMSLAKPVLATDTGGTKEIVNHNKSGYLVMNQKEEEIVDMIIGLINDEEKCISFGKRGRQIIEENFMSADMGAAFEKVYKESLQMQ